MKDNTTWSVPRHLGIIMDGNGRWAKKRGLPRKIGHKYGAETFKKITRYCRDMGVEVLTVYAFSTENWKRSPDEVTAIMNLLRAYLKDTVNYMGDNIKTRFIGDLSRLDDDITELIHKTEADSAEFTAMTLNIAVNYGGRDEVLAACRTLAKQVRVGTLEPEQIDEEAISRTLYTAGQPDVDLIIRSSGEKRLSNFMIWQAAYAEFVVFDELWPDFKPKHIDLALQQYNQRQRRFGGA